MSQGGYTHITRASGTILTAAIYNNDHQNHIINQNPLMTGAYSDTLAQFQSVADPGAIGSESFAPSLAGEIERLRWQIRAITGEAQWNQPPSSNLKGVAGAPDGSIGLQKLAYTTQGNILMRTASGFGAWQQSQIKDLASLVPVSGDFLLGQPAAGGAPRKIDIKDAVGNPGVIMPQGRLTLSTGVTHMTGNYVAIGTLFYTPYVGSQVPIYNGSTVVAVNMGGELSQTSIDNTKSPAAAAANAVYDIFFWLDPVGNTPRISRGPPWTNATTRGTGAGTSELVRQSGLLVNKFDIVNGPLALRGTYLGSVWTRSDAKFAFIQLGGGEQAMAAFAGVYNYYHRAWTIATTRQTANWNVGDDGANRLVADSGNNVIYVLGGVENHVDCRMYAAYTPGIDAEGNFGNTVQAWIGRDSTSDMYSISTGTSYVVGGPSAGRGGGTNWVPYQVFHMRAEGVDLMSGGHSYWMCNRTLLGTGNAGPGVASPPQGIGIHAGRAATMMFANFWY